jgi:hypothetical protein
MLRASDERLNRCSVNVKAINVMPTNTASTAATRRIRLPLEIDQWLFAEATHVDHTAGPPRRVC